MVSQAILVSSTPKASLTFKGMHNSLSLPGLTRKADSWPARERRCYTKLVTGCNFQKLSASICERHYTKKSSFHHKLHEINCTSAASEGAYIPEPNSEISKGRWIEISQKLDALYRFTRPHTIIGTIVGITSVSLLPVENVADLSPMFFVGLVKALVPALFMNIYVVGLNQLFDIEIDKINKPNLPLASGEFSVETGAAIVVASAVMSFVLGLAAQSPPLIYALVISFILGTAYSVTLPLLRWKQNAFLAASCILCVRAIVVQLAFFVHMQRCVLGRPTVLTKSVIFATAFMCFFTAVIALFKDIPDVDGDKDFGIQSFSVCLGQSNVFWLCIKLLLIAYGTAVLVGVFSSNTYWRLVTVLGHGLLATILWLRAQDLDIHNKTSITTFYMFIWKLFYAEYFLIPFVH